MKAEPRVMPVRMQVPLLDLKPQYRALEAELRAAIDKVCASQHFILGPEVKQFEENVAAYCQSRYGIGVSSGTDALLVALMALQVGPGDEVVTSPYTFFATGGAIARVGARPVFCDIDPRTYNLSPQAVQAFIDERCEPQQEGLIHRDTGGRVKALMPVHLYGQMADMQPLMQIAGRHGLKVIEDAAQAIGSEYPGAQGAPRRAGSMGDIGCFSFFPTKNLGAFGDAGLCTTQDPRLAEQLRILRVHGSQPKYFHSLIGGNFRLDELQAAVLRIKLQHLDAWTSGRRRNAAFYNAAFDRAGLSGDIALPEALPGYRHIYNQYVIRAPQRDRLREHLAQWGVGTEIYYPLPLHRQQCFEYLGYGADDCPHSVRAAQETLALPIYPELSEEQLGYVVESIQSFYS